MYVPIPIGTNASESDLIFEFYIDSVADIASRTIFNNEDSFCERSVR